MTWLHCLIIALVACIVTILLVPPARTLAFKVDAVDYPSERRVNKEPTARLGGIAIFGGMVAGLAALAIGIGLFGWNDPFAGPVASAVSLPGVAIGVVVMFATGIVDDIWGLKPWQKLLGQIASATIIALSGLLLADIQNPFGRGFIDLGWAAYPITIFYLVAFANIINLIDGLDGLASGICAISALTMFTFAMLMSRTSSAFLCIVIVGACIGFLRYNFHPASIFMGDSGSLVLGLSLGVVSLFATTRSALVVSLLVPIVTAGVPIIDTASAIIRRVRKHQPIQKADRGHIHHQLMREGFGQRSTVLIMWAWTAILSVSVLFIVQTKSMARIPFIILALGISIFFIWKLKLLGGVLRHHYNPRPSTNSPRLGWQKDDEADEENAVATAASENDSTGEKTSE